MTDEVDLRTFAGMNLPHGLAKAASFEGVRLLAWRAKALCQTRGKSSAMRLLQLPISTAVVSTESSPRFG